MNAETFAGCPTIYHNNEVIKKLTAAEALSQSGRKPQALRVMFLELNPGEALQLDHSEYKKHTIQSTVCNIRKSRTPKNLVVRTHHDGLSTFVICLD